MSAVLTEGKVQKERADLKVGPYEIPESAVL